MVRILASEPIATVQNGKKKPLLISLIRAILECCIRDNISGICCVHT